MSYSDEFNHEFISFEDIIKDIDKKIKKHDEGREHAQRVARWGGAIE